MPRTSFHDKKNFIMEVDFPVNQIVQDSLEEFFHIKRREQPTSHFIGNTSTTVA